jgi:hypothetical protein
LLQSTTCASSNARLNLFSLGLKHRRSKQCHLLALLRAAQDFGVVEIAYPDANHSWRVLVAFLDEHEQRTTGPTAASRSSSCGASTSRATATGATSTATPARR